jgi:hypothetical protein
MSAADIVIGLDPATVDLSVIAEKCSDVQGEIIEEEPEEEPTDEPDDEPDELGE